ncbi:MULTISPECIES: TetR/AcrR family transcriptional regulator [unclassified Amycolatopsis]|uniref:TetR/AcrR family transcriptional regulator n=1 Tax=unclassified Amycolatopsis TaxID=2618356 RepID=UPI001FF30098|nr:TetR/AcrR family transcriptional regulator [Amycolatopsis sp. FBCC-B4732]UOX90044.1 TetR/AcrR family transcriptional regulator [Amycolatopsis sp. FBCC-B4732]
MATRHLPMRPADQGSRERFLDAALSVLVNRGVPSLTVRGVAEAAGASTISVYARFGGRSGLLDALYERTFDSLREMLETLPPSSSDGLADLLHLALEYRHFARESPARYALMFERPVPGFDPDPALRSAVLRTTFRMFIERVQRVSPPGTDAQAAAYQLWTAMHGLVGSELMLASRTPLTDWFIPPTEEANEAVYRQGVSAMMRGLGLR